MREYYNKLPREDQESFDQAEVSIRALLGLDPDRVYTIEDLNDEEVHDRALRLLYRARFGQVNEYARISPHINYDQLDRTVSDHIKSKLSIAAGIIYVYHTYRHLRTARKYQILIRQHPTTLGYGVLLDLPLPGREQTEAIATLAGLHLDEVTALALNLEGPVLFTQEFVSAVTEHLREYVGSCTFFSIIYIPKLMAEEP